MTARNAWRHAWRRARQARIDDEPPELFDAYAWAAWLLIGSRGDEISPRIAEDSRPWRLP